MSKEQIYLDLENAAVSYTDIKDVPVVSCGEPLIPISLNDNLHINQIGVDMLPITGEEIYVRSSVMERLGAASMKLAQVVPTKALQVVYGYRALSIQQKLFEVFKKDLEGNFTGLQLLEAVHRLIAVPEVAGHPTGGAVDIQLVSKGEPLDFGTRIWEFVPDSFTFSPFVSEQAKTNRALLRTVMMAVGFAPFDGEWWHFSYGDKEWAKYYNQPNAIYEQIEFAKEANF